MQCRLSGRVLAFACLQDLAHDDLVDIFRRDAGALERDWADEYQPNASVEAAWRLVYDDASPSNDLYRLGETLTRLDQQFSLYRWRHFVSVERIIGYKAGTGGSSGG